MFARNRNGMVMGISMAVIIILVITLFGINLLSRQSYREIGRIDEFLKAVAAGEACYQEISTRLESAPWEQRWFKGRQDFGKGDWTRPGEARASSYKSLIADGDRPYQADLLVQATAGDTTVVMYWKLRADPFGLSPYRRIKSIQFAYQDPSIPISKGGLDAVTAKVNDVLKEREKNRSWVEGKQAKIALNPGIGGLGPVLNLPDNPAPIEKIPPTTPASKPPPPSLQNPGRSFPLSPLLASFLNPTQAPIPWRPRSRSRPSPVTAEPSSALRKS